MENRLAPLLREWRVARRLSVGALAARAGVAKATVSGWEAGHHLPRLPELTAVLAALEVSPRQREQALLLLPVPRAQRARALTLPPVPGLDTVCRPVPGHLLRAMRLRRGHSLRSVALQLGVEPSTLSRWERSESAPPSERLRALLDLLGARPEERAALAEGRRLLEPLAPDEPVSLDVLVERLALLESAVEHGSRALMDLEFLLWKERTWRLAAESEAARELLADGCSRYAVWLSWDDRKREAAEYARRALALVGEPGPNRLELPSRERAVHVAALVIGRGGGRDGPRRAVEWLRSWLLPGSTPYWESFLCREMAEHALQAGEHAAALAFAGRACELAARLEDPFAPARCRDVTIDVLRATGRHREALRLLESIDEEGIPIQRILAALRWAHVLSALGERTAAAQHLAEARDLIAGHGYPNFDRTVEQLARRL